MRLTEDQKTAVRSWAAEGATLGDIQKRLGEEFDVNITYMEARFLISDLNVTLQDKDRAPEKPIAAAPAEDLVEEDFEEGDLGGDGDGLDDMSFGTGKVSVSVDQIAKPSAMLSGKVSFSDGETAEWSVDHYGQLRLNASSPAYRPSDEDLVAFQRELQTAARRAGFM